MELRDVTAENWRDVVRVEPREDQKRFVASVAYYLNLCHYEENWRPWRSTRTARSSGSRCGVTTPRKRPTGSVGSS
jgi:hypothetical protein